MGGCSAGCAHRAAHRVVPRARRVARRRAGRRGRPAARAGRRPARGACPLRAHAPVLARDRQWHGLLPSVRGTKEQARSRRAPPRPNARQSAMHRGLFLGARPRGVPAPPGHLWTAATIALAGRPSEPESPRIHGNPRLSPRFQALVPETERDRGRSTAIPETRNPHTCRVFEAMELRGLEPPTSCVRSRRSRCQSGRYRDHMLAPCLSRGRPSGPSGTPANPRIPRHCRASFEWAVLGSNQRPPACKAGALTS